MKVINHPIEYYGKTFRFNSFWGCLIREQKMSETTELLENIDDAEKQRCVEAVIDPFKMRERNKSLGWKKIRYPRLARSYAMLLTWLCAHCYPIANLLFIHLKLNLFKNGCDASNFYYSVYPEMKIQHTLCLPRTIFISTTSQRFREHGVAFIGTFLPTVRMHAWVVEDGMPVDRFDKQWIYFQPVVMLL